VEGNGSANTACVLTLVKANTDKQRVMPRIGKEHHHH